MNPDRRRVDPDGRYPTDGLTRVEALALTVMDLLPDAAFERTRSAFEFEDGGERGIVVVVTPESVELRLPSVEWTMGAYGPARTSRLWKRVASERLDAGALQRHVEAARRARESEFHACRFCGEEVPPEHRHEHDVCHGCAERHLGVVH